MLPAVAVSATAAELLLQKRCFPYDPFAFRESARLEFTKHPLVIFHQESR